MMEEYEQGRFLDKGGYGSAYVYKKKSNDLEYVIKVGMCCALRGGMN